MSSRARSAAAPSRQRYVVGRTGSFDCPTVEKIDVCLRALTLRLLGGTDVMVDTVAINPVEYRTIWFDLDLLLDARLALTSLA